MEFFLINFSFILTISVSKCHRFQCTGFISCNFTEFIISNFKVESHGFSAYNTSHIHEDDLLLPFYLDTSVLFFLAQLSWQGPQYYVK